METMPRITSGSLSFSAGARLSKSEAKYSSSSFSRVRGLCVPRRSTQASGDASVAYGPAYASRAYGRRRTRACYF